jgi:hypothetical protein
MIWMKCLTGRSNTLTGRQLPAAPESVAAEIRLHGATPINSFGTGEQK